MQSALRTPSLRFMKNATQNHQDQIAIILSGMGCSAVKLGSQTIVASRPGRDGRTYSLSVDIYEDLARAANSPLRFRARVSRQFGLPVCSHHGASVEDALSSVQWHTLDRSGSVTAAGPMAGVIAG
ncbi:MAG: hypothetical protein ACI8X5_000923 [Planctomycetota bacterium]|jgi:hypothetical protein